MDAQAAVETTRREWEEGHRRLEALADDAGLYRRLLAELEVVTDELRRRVGDDAGLDVHLVYTRKAPADSPAAPKRIDVAALNTYGWPPDFAPDCFVCGPTTFVETAADILVALGHDARRIRTERFGGTS